MSDIIEADAPRSRNVPREAIFQRMVVAFIQQVVLPPTFTTAICHENELTDNARARAKARGVQGGVPDIYACQAPARSVWLELKWGTNKPSDAQIHVADELWKCGIPRGFCWSMPDVLRTLRDAQMRLHGNADNLAVEYQARAEAAVARAEINKGKAPRKGAARPRARKATPGQMARFSASRLGL